LFSDRLLRDIVLEAERAPDMGSLLRERVYAIDSQARSFVAGWISVLSGNPHAGLSTVLPALIDGLFNALADNNKETHSLVWSALESALQEAPRCDVEKMIPIVSQQLLKTSDVVWTQRYLALVWLRALIPLKKDATVKSAPVVLEALFKLPEDELTNTVSQKKYKEIRKNRFSISKSTTFINTEKVKFRIVFNLFKLLF
jgi:hypothetical protein